MYKSNGGKKKKDFDRNARRTVAQMTGVNIIKYLYNIYIYDVYVCVEHFDIIVVL